MMQMKIAEKNGLMKNQLYWPPHDRPNHPTYTALVYQPPQSLARFGADPRGGLYR